MRQKYLASGHREHFKEAATRYLMENHHKRSISNDANQIERLSTHIGEMRSG